ncbi:MAG TPA: hypothetical protein VEH84_16565, partial [Alphaproteobacteria bacterium]|nr:hypothetical protein [Alphaproteobacteria bacterium]
MPENARAISLSDEEYEEFEDELTSTARGRAFLREWDRRARLIAMEELKRYLRDRRETLTFHVAEEALADEGVAIVRRQLQEMSACIQQTRTEINALQPENQRSQRIIEATEELDAIVKSAESATNTILTSAETIMQLIDRLPAEAALRPSRDAIEGLCIEILTACSFQDITGQRTTKVVTTLRYIEQRVNSMMKLWGLAHGIAPDPKATMSKL